MTMHRQNETLERTQSTVDLLNRALRLEYSLIIHYPRLANSAGDGEIRDLINSLGSASIEHANTVVDAIKELGGVPTWSFEPLPEGKDLLAIMKTQLEREKAAQDLHRRNAEVVTSPSLRSRLAAMVNEEEVHIQTVTNIIRRLTESGE
jgi:bacterioferritin (cytochrome b1)